MVRIATGLGRPAARLLLYPICAFYLVFAARARRAIKPYLRRVLGRPAGWSDLYRQYFTFASTILDRVFFLRGEYEHFQIEFHGADLVREALSHGHGCILLGSHFGSFEVARAVALMNRAQEVKLLMYQENAAKIRDVLAAINPELAGFVIETGTPDTMLRVRECLDRNGLVGLLGDRMLHDKDDIVCQFLGTPARFPRGIMRLIGLLQAPVVMFFSIYQGGNRYTVHFELLADKIDLSGPDKAARLQQWMQRYVDRLEYYCRLAPNNWFNFFDFWDEL
jgi:predicted LPLAT superfamily acyltransferase